MSIIRNKANSVVRSGFCSTKYYPIITFPATFIAYQRKIVRNDMIFPPPPFR